MSEKRAGYEQNTGKMRVGYEESTIEVRGI